jgi:hypothetical protein
MDFSNIQTFLSDPAAANALAIFGIVVMTSVFISIFIYLLGIFLANDKLKGWGKNEFFEIFYSGIVFSAIMFAVPTLNIVINDLFASSDPISQQLCEISTFPPSSPYYGVGSCHIRLAIYYLHSMFDEASKVSRSIYLNYLFTSVMADLSIAIEFVFEMAGFFTYQPIRGFFTIGNIIKTQMFDILTKLMMATKFQEILIVFIERALFLNLLVVGIILRIPAFTRRLGGLLIAIAMALYFIYPMFYAFGALIINDIKHKIDPNVGLETASSVSVVERMYMSGSIPILSSNIDLGYDKMMEAGEAKKKLESGELLRDSALEKGFLPSPTQLTAEGELSPEEINNRMNKMKEAYKKAWGWFEDVMKKKWYDPLVLIAYEEGGPIDAAARIAFFSVFFGFVAIMATIAAIRSLSIVLGGDIEIAGLTHLI